MTIYDEAPFHNRTRGLHRAGWQVLYGYSVILYPTRNQYSLGGLSLSIPFLESPCLTLVEAIRQ